MFRSTPRIAYGVSLLALLAVPAAAAAQVAAPAMAVPGAQTADIVVVAYGLGADRRTGQQVPPAQPSTPPSEATPERAPANPAIRAYPRQADGHGVKLGGYNLSRWAEDWRLMRDPAKRNDPLDRLKYLPLDADGDIYLTLSGEMRLRADHVSNPGLIDSDHRREDKLRLVGGADLHIGPVRFFGELAHGGLGGRNYGAPTAKLRNDLFAQQMFGEISGSVGPALLGARYGRQEFTDGPAGLVSQKDNNTIRTVLDGLRGWAQISDVRVDLFDFEQVKLGMEGIDDDASDHGTRFSGVTAGVVLANTKTRKLFLDPFVWRERNDRQRWGSVTAREVRRYYGARLWGSIDSLTLDWAVAHQSGDFDGRDISAWNLFIAQTYLLDAKGWAPKPGIHFDFGSGGGSFGTSTLRASKAVTAGTNGYSYQGVLGLTNLFQVSPNLTVSPARTLDVTAEYQRSWRVTETDAVYRGSGTAYAGSQRLGGSHVGDALRLQASWKITPRLSLTARYEYFLSGDLLDQLGYADSHFLASWASFRF